MRVRTKREVSRGEQRGQEGKERRRGERTAIAEPAEVASPPFRRGRRGGAAEVRLTKTVIYPGGPPGSLKRRAQWDIQGENPEVETKENQQTSVSSMHS